MNRFKAIKTYHDKIEQNLKGKSQLLQISAKLKEDTMSHTAFATKNFEDAVHWKMLGAKITDQRRLAIETSLTLERKLL